LLYVVLDFKKNQALGIHNKTSLLRRTAVNYEEYHQTYFSDPMPEHRFNFCGTFGVALFFEQFESAVDYYQKVLGPPAYMEGIGTRGWQIGCGWLTLLKGRTGSPSNAEVIIQMDTPEQAERIQQAFISAGGRGPEPSDQMMYMPVRYCPVIDPFGTQLLFVSLLDSEGE
jgi:hypothetical protein